MRCRYGWKTSQKFELVHSPTEGFFRPDFWKLEGNTWLAARLGPHPVRLLVVDTNAHDIEVHYGAQLVREC